MKITKIINIEVLVLLALLSKVYSMRIKIVPNTQNNQKMIEQNQLQAYKDVKLIVDGSGEYIYQDSNYVFTIPQIHGGIHIIEAISNEFLFPVLLIDKRVEGSPKMKWMTPLDRKIIKPVEQAIMTPLDKIKYYDPEPGSFLMSFLMGGNGLFILMGILMVFCYKTLGKLQEAQMAPPAPSGPPSR